jgi:ABC-type glycerol-3-phosphate transport system substrate-binding protein
MALPEAPGYDALQETITAFEEEKGVMVNVIVKLPSGEEGILNWLRKTKPAAPSVLPDVVALPLSDIATAADEDLLQPMDPWLSQQLMDDYYPFAQQAGTAREAWVAMPFAANFEHLAFQPAALSEPPVSWDIVLASSTQYSFPVGGPESMWTDAVLLHYLSTIPDGESPERNEKALRRQLDFYENLFRGGFIDESILQISHPEGTWEQVLKGTVALGETTSNLWLAQKEEATLLRFGPTPPEDGEGRYIIHGWAYALITADETRQNLAMELIARLIDTQTLSDWSIQAQVLPARRSSLALWPANEFRSFSNEAMEKGFLMPLFTQDKEMARAVHQAARAVLGGEMSADEAWRLAISEW